MKTRPFRCRFGKGAARCALWLALVFSAAPVAMAVPHLAPGFVVGAPGQTVAIPLQLTGTAPSSAGFNATIYLPAGVTLTGVVRGSLLPSPGFFLLAHQLADPSVNAVAVLGYSESQVIARTGLLCTLMVAIPSNAAPGDYPIVLNAPDRSPTVRGSHALSSADGASSVAHTVGNGVLSVTVTALVQKVTALVCADYDGDGKADPAVYDEATGTWKVKLSSADYYLMVTMLNGLGGPGYASVTADYDGDHKADPAVYQELTGRWIILPSSANYAVAIVMSQPLGGAGYSGMPADYDGDQLADPGVYLREQGDWKVLLSSANYYLVELLGLLGGTGYRAVAADYDGDHKADPAVYGESNGVWAFLLSSADYASLVMAQTLGGVGYIPVPADYDGDGLADPAVKSETGNEWIVMFSSGNYTPTYITVLFE